MLTSGFNVSKRILVLSTGSLRRPKSLGTTPVCPGTFAPSAGSYRPSPTTPAVPLLVTVSAVSSLVNHLSSHLVTSLFQLEMSL